MWISKKKYNEHLSQSGEEVARIYQSKIDKLNTELENAKDLKSILEKLYPLCCSQFLTADGVSGNYRLNLPDAVLQYTEDILGGKVIKQEGNKCLVVDKQGNVKTGLTKQKVDKGYTYKLIRE